VNTPTTTAAAFDLDSAVQLDTAELQLKHPATGAPTGAFVLLAGPEHDVRRQRLFALMRRRRAEFERLGKLMTSDPVEDAAAELELLAACTLGWRNLSVGGQELAYSAAACAALYADPRRAWVRDQVKAALDQRDLFIGSSASV
jgi:hypothetical protein